MQFISSSLKRFIRCETASATIEFVLWVPLLIIWLLSIVVFFDAFKTRGALISTNATVTDIVSRNTQIWQDYMDLLQLMQSSMLSSPNGSGIRISSILFTLDPDEPDEPGVYTVEWSGVTGTMDEELEDDDIQIEILPDMYSSETILLVETVINYQPITKFIGFTFTQLHAVSAVSPRYDSRVAWTDD